MLHPPHRSTLAMVLLKTGSGICLQVTLSLLTSLGTYIHISLSAELPCLLLASELQLFYSDHMR